MTAPLKPRRRIRGYERILREGEAAGVPRRSLLETMLAGCLDSSGTDHQNGRTIAVVFDYILPSLYEAVLKEARE